MKGSAARWILIIAQRDMDILQETAQGERPSGTEGRDRLPTHRRGRGTKPRGRPRTTHETSRCSPPPSPPVPCAACHRPPDPLGERQSGTEGRDRSTRHREGRGTKPGGPPPTPVGYFRCPSPLPGVPWAGCHRPPDPLGERPSRTEGRDRSTSHREGRGTIAGWEDSEVR